MSFFDLGLVQGQIVPELIMAENKDPFRLTEFQKKSFTTGTGGSRFDFFAGGWNRFCCC